MSLRIVYYVVISSLPFISCSIWSVELSGSTLILKKDQIEAYKGDAKGQSLDLSNFGVVNPLEWSDMDFPQPMTGVPLDLPTSFDVTKFTNFRQISPTIYMASFRDDSARMGFFGTENSSFICGSTDNGCVLGGRDSFSCSTSNADILMEGLFVPEPSLEDSARDGPFSFDVAITESSPGGSDEAAQDALVVAIYRIMFFSSYRECIESIRDGNTSRRNKNRVPIAFLYLFLYMALTLWLMMSGIWHSWYLCICPNLCEPVYNSSQNRLILVWITIYLIIGNILVWSLGVPTWIGLSLVLGLVMAIFTLFKYCGSNKQRLFRNEEGLSWESFTKSPSKGKGNNSRFFVTPIELATVENPSPAMSPMVNGEDMIHMNSLEGDATSFPRTWKKRGNLLRIIAVFILILLAAILITMGVWQSDDYIVFSRELHTDVVEFQLPEVVKTAAAMYSFDNFATKMNVDDLNRLQTDWCGKTFNKKLTSTAEKKDKIEDDYIEPFQIDMSLFQRPSFNDYDSVNDWFTRKIIPSVRPISQLADDSVLSSPADARVMVFETIPRDFTFWIKNEEFTLEAFLGSKDLSDTFKESTMIILRLAPQDYHRFHSPLVGTITSQKSLKGSIFSVNSDAMTSSNLAILNQRTVTIFDSPNFGEVAFVAIGATCVGSIEMTAKVGDTLSRGQDLGYFQFGGSSIVLLLRERVIVVDDDLLYRSSMKVETLLTMGSRLGIA